MRCSWTTSTFPLFLYGTLRAGGARHGLIAPYLESAVPSRVWGRLYHAPAGYPALEVPEACWLAHGTADPVADAVLASGMGTVTPVCPEGDWGWVLGDVVELRDPGHSIPPVDAYEDFRPGGPCLYARVLLAVEVGDGALPAWAYVKAPSGGDRRITSGEWRPESNPDWGG